MIPDIKLAKPLRIASELYILSIKGNPIHSSIVMSSRITSMEWSILVEDVIMHALEYDSRKLGVDY